MQEKCKKLEQPSISTSSSISENEQIRFVKRPKLVDYDDEIKSSSEVEVDQATATNIDSDLISVEKLKLLGANINCFVL